MYNSEKFINMEVKYAKLIKDPFMPLFMLKE